VLIPIANAKIIQEVGGTYAKSIPRVHDPLVMAQLAQAAKRLNIRKRLSRAIMGSTKPFGVNATKLNLLRKVFKII